MLDGKRATGGRCTAKQGTDVKPTDETVSAGDGYSSVDDGCMVPLATSNSARLSPPSTSSLWSTEGGSQRRMPSPTTSNTSAGSKVAKGCQSDVPRTISAKDKAVRSASSTSIPTGVRAPLPPLRGEIRDKSVWSAASEGTNARGEEDRPNHQVDDTGDSSRALEKYSHAERSSRTTSSSRLTSRKVCQLYPRQCIGTILPVSKRRAFHCDFGARDC